jgi:hypothetical protein
MSRRSSRRKFLQGCAAAGVASFFINPADAAQPNPKERVRLGIIGVNGKGGSNLGEIEKTGLAEIVALCDVDADRSAPVRERLKNARFYDDYRRLIEQKDVQAVVISTPDHHHAFAALAALRARKHVYCEKPLAHSVQEVRLMMQTAAKEKVVTQMGTQIHAGDNYRRVVEMCRPARSAPSAASRSGATPRSSPASASRIACPFPGGSTTTSGSDRPPNAATRLTASASTASTSTGAGGGTSAAACWPTWRATTWTCRTGP